MAYSYLLFAFHLCVWAHVYMGRCAGQGSTSDDFLSQLPPSYFWDSVSHFYLDLADSRSLAGWWIPGKVYPSPHPLCCDYNWLHATILGFSRAFWVSNSGPHARGWGGGGGSKHFAASVIFPVLPLLFLRQASLHLANLSTSFILQTYLLHSSWGVPSL